MVVLCFAAQSWNLVDTVSCTSEASWSHDFKKFFSLKKLFRSRLRHLLWNIPAIPPPPLHWMSEFEWICHQIKIDSSCYIKQIHNNYKNLVCMCACTLKKWQQYMRMSTLDILIVFRTYFYTCTFIVYGDRREKILTIFFQSEECWQHENSLVRLRKALNVVTPRRKVAHNRSCKQKNSAVDLSRWWK